MTIEDFTDEVLEKVLNDLSEDQQKEMLMHTLKLAGVADEITKSTLQAIQNNKVADKRADKKTIAIAVMKNLLQKMLESDPTEDDKRMTRVAVVYAVLPMVQATP